MAIKFYKTRDPHGYMGNYYKRRVFVYGRWWNTTEHAYQAQKCTDPAEYDAIWKTVKANDSRNLGQTVKVREDWHTGYKDIVMKQCLLAKFLQHKDLRDQLIATGDEILIEDSPVDSYWGCGADGLGVNRLGQLLMEVREELKGE